MAVITEFTVASDEFPLGRSFSLEEEGMRIELERIVPTGSGIIPYFWVETDNPEAFERRARRNTEAKEVVRIDEVDGSYLYRIVWTSEVDHLVQAIIDAQAVILEAWGNGEWAFRLRLPDHARLADFHNIILEHSIDLNFQRIYTLDEEQRGGYIFDLTPEQNEALATALNMGYFQVPREIKLEDVADELGITRQAASERIRRGTQKVFESVFFGPPRIGSEVDEA